MDGYLLSTLNGNPLRLDLMALCEMFGFFPALVTLKVAPDGLVLTATPPFGDGDKQARVTTPHALSCLGPSAMEAVYRHNGLTGELDCLL